MSENKLREVIDTSLSNIKELVDVNTVVGTPISTPNGTTIIPVSKVSMGFASGGVDYFGKHMTVENKTPNFGAGGGTGVTVSPLGFLIVKPDGSVDLLNVAFPTGPAAAPDLIESISALIEKSPEIISRIKTTFAKKEDKAESTEAADNTASEKTE